MPIKYVTDGPWGPGTGTRLPAADIDNNFYETQQEIQGIIDNLPQPAEISNFQVEGSQLMIFLSDGRSFGPYTLPTAMLQFRGEWVAPTHYYELDIFSVPGKGLYMVRIAHDTIAPPFNPDAVDGGGNALYLLLFGVNPVLYDVGIFYPNVIGNGLDADGYIGAHLFARTVYFESGLPFSKAKLRIAPADALDIKIARVQAGTVVPDADWGTLSFASGETDGTFSTSGGTPLQFEDGDMIVFKVPAVIDMAAKDLAVTLVGNVGLAAT